MAANTQAQRRRRAEADLRTARRIVYQRDGGRCARCALSVHGIPSSVHHRRRRGMGGTHDPRSHDPRNLVLVCGTGTTGCHGWIESHRGDAYVHGWLIRSHDDLDTPLVDIAGRVIYLHADGTRTPAA